VNADRRPFLVAEIGVNHDGDGARATEMVRAAATAGFDAVKFQYWIEDELLSADTPNAPYQGAGDQRELLRSLHLDIDQLSEIRALARNENVAFGITADGVRALERAQALAPDFVKVGSGDADNPWLLDAVAKSGLPVVLSVGMSSDEDVLWMLEKLQSAEDLTVLHCVTAYPTPLEYLDLSRMIRLSDMTGRPVGLSDHTIGVAAASAAFALGAAVIEKHVTWSSTAPGPDHGASLPMDAANRWTRDVRGVYEAIHSSRHFSEEDENRSVVRKGLYSTHDLDRGATIELDDLVPLRPLLDGIPASERDNVVGRVLTTPVESGARLTWSSLV
jgi:N,N'-diacetyllegionaminate synthase